MITIDLNKPLTCLLLEDILTFSLKEPFNVKCLDQDIGADCHKILYHPVLIPPSPALLILVSWENYISKALIMSYCYDYQYYITNCIYIGTIFVNKRTRM